jgi:hypothetical protein
LYDLRPMGSKRGGTKTLVGSVVWSEIRASYCRGPLTRLNQL